MNHLKNVESLRNRYFVLRHGRSEANEEGIILSNPSDGVKSYGLTEEGRAQVLKSVREFTERSDFSDDLFIFSSDFKRAYETALIVSENTEIRNITVEKRLRERFFGEFDKKSDSNYKIVWEHDEADNGKDFFSVESVYSVQERTSLLITDIESRISGKFVILVSHGDALQILQTAFLKVSPCTHRKLTHLSTGEIRELVLDSSVRGE